VCCLKMMPTTITSPPLRHLAFCPGDLQNQLPIRNLDFCRSNDSRCTVDSHVSEQPPDPVSEQPPDPGKRVTLRTCSVSGKEFRCMTPLPSQQKLVKFEKLFALRDSLSGLSTVLETSATMQKIAASNCYRFLCEPFSPANCRNEAGLGG
jgi:hypothetical protein